MSLADGTGPDRRDFAQAHATRAAGDQPLAPTTNGSGKPGGKPAPSTELSPWQQEVAEALSEADPLERNDKVWALLRTKAAAIVASDRRLSEQRTAVKAIGKDLLLNLTNQEAPTVSKVVHSV